MGADLRLAVAAALSRANRSLKAIEELKALPAPAPELDVGFQVIEGRLIVTINGEQQDLGRVAGEDGDSVSLDDVRKLVTTWLAENISQPKDGDSPSIEQIADVASRWLEANVELLRGEPGKPADQVDLQALLSELKGMSAEWLAKNIKQPRDGRDPTFEEIQTAVGLWMEFNIDEHLPGLEELRAIAETWLAANLRQPKDGESVTAAQAQAALDAWMAKNYKAPKDGDPGKTIILPGIGLDRVEQPNAETVRFVLTSGKHFDIKLPKGKPARPDTVFLGSSSAPGSASRLKEVPTDPADPADGDTWVLRSLNNAAGTLQAFVGGFPLVTEVDDFKYQFSLKTINEGIKRVELT